MKNDQTLEQWATSAPRIQAGAYEARRCPDCGHWIFTGAGPFAEGDRTKTVAELNHYERFHAEQVEQADGPMGSVGMFPFMRFNEAPVEARLDPSTRMSPRLRARLTA